MSRTLTFLAILSAASATCWGQAVDFNATGGTVTGGTGFFVSNAVVSNPPGTLNLNCPSMANCAGGTLTIQSTDGLTTLNATLNSGAVTVTRYGGGRVSYTYFWNMAGNYSGTLTVNGQTKAVTGDTAVHLPKSYSPTFTTSTVSSSMTAAFPAYAPVFVTDAYFDQIVKIDDFTGTNWTTYGSVGNGVGKFAAPWGISVDAANRIYVVDSANARVVRMDDMKGTNWVTLGKKGIGINEFTSPAGLFLDSTGRIYVADAGNARIVRMDDISGTNWTTLGTSGTGTGQFSSPVAVTVDGLGRIYVLDGARLVRMDDMTGANWTVSSVAFTNPVNIGLDSLARIFVSDLRGYVFRMDDMSGTNFAASGGGTLGSPYALFVDTSGAVYTGDYLGPQALSRQDDMTGQGFTAYGSFRTVQGVGYFTQPAGMFLPTVPPSTAAIVVSGSSLAFGSLNVNTTSAPQTITLTNTGSATLNGSITIGSNFTETDNCSTLAVGATCTISVNFAPTTTGPLTGNIVLNNNAVNNPAPISLTGTGTAPGIALSFTSLTFAPQLLNTASAVQAVTLTNPGTGPLTPVVSASGDFAQTNNCGTSVAPGATCTISVTFTPTVAGMRTGSLSIADNVPGSPQVVGLAGTGATTAPAVTVTPVSLTFPPQVLKKPSAVQTVSVTNTGTTSVGLGAVAVTGDFSRTTTCKTTLAAGKSCTASVKFTPTAVGIRSGSVTVNFASLPAQTVALSGTGTSGGGAGVLTVSPTSIAFGFVVPGDPLSLPVTVTNNTGAIVGISHISIPMSTVFTETNTCPSLLGVGASCTVTVTFSPVDLIAYSANLTVTESSGGVETVPLSGTGGSN